MRLVASVALLACLVACGKDDGKKPPEPPKAEELPALEVPPAGVASIAKMSYPWGEGRKAWLRADELRGKKEPDWAAIRAAAEEAIAKDGDHLQAHHLLGVALAQLGEPAKAAEHLLIALAGDFIRWGNGLPVDERLRDFLTTPHGKALLARHLELKADVEKRIHGGVWVVGRRSTFKWPARSGPASTRGDLYAFDPETRRFLRITHTGDQLAAWLPSPAGDRIALVGYDRAELGKTDKDPPRIRAWVETIDARTFEPLGKRATFNKARAVAVTWGAGGQVLVDKLDPVGRWALRPVATYTIDPSTGKTAKSAAATDPQSGRAQVSLDETVVRGPGRGLRLTPAAADPALITELTLESSGRTISIPESGLGDASVPRASPSGARAAFATWVDPCGADDAAKPSLYVVEASSGQTRHLLTTDSRFNVRWLDDERLVYEDGTGGLRIWDATTGREVMKIAEKAGLGLHGLSASPKPICRKEPLDDVETAAPDEPVEEEEPPPRDEPAPGPATTPDP